MRPPALPGCRSFAHAGRPCHPPTAARLVATSCKKQSKKQSKKQELLAQFHKGKIAFFMLEKCPKFPKKRPGGL
jgi:hypothetical protein